MCLRMSREISGRLVTTKAQSYQPQELRLRPDGVPSGTFVAASRLSSPIQDRGR